MYNNSTASNNKLRDEMPRDIVIDLDDTLNDDNENPEDDIDELDFFLNDQLASIRNSVFGITAYTSTYHTIC